jgi:hypothetical protein
LPATTDSASAGAVEVIPSVWKVIWKFPLVVPAPLGKPK